MRIEQESPEDIFRGVVENAVHLADSGSSPEDLVEELCNSEGLAHVSLLNYVRLSSMLSGYFSIVLQFQTY